MAKRIKNILSIIGRTQGNIHDYHGSFLLRLGSRDENTITPCRLVENNGSVSPTLEKYWYVKCPSWLSKTITPTCRAFLILCASVTKYCNLCSEF